MISARKCLVLMAILYTLGFLTGWSARAAEPSFTPATAASELAVDYIAPLVRPDTKPVSVKVRYCRPARAGWAGCRVRIAGATTCTALIRVRVPVHEQYVGWVPRMRCW